VEYMAATECREVGGVHGCYPKGNVQNNINNIPTILNYFFEN